MDRHRVQEENIEILDHLEVMVETFGMNHHHLTETLAMDPLIATSEVNHPRPPQGTSGVNHRIETFEEESRRTGTFEEESRRTGTFEAGSHPIETSEATLHPEIFEENHRLVETFEESPI
jgi:hypothetical protein